MSFGYGPTNRIQREVIMVDWTKLRPQHARAPERLGDRILRMIRDGELADGARLPSERELSKIAGISRGTVREAMKDLELRGLVSRTPGRGTLVTSHSRPDLAAGLFGAMNTTERVLREVMDLRAAIEPPIAERAAVRAQVSEMDSLKGIVEEAEHELTAGTALTARLVELDVAFHLQIAHMTNNPMLVQMLEVANEWIAMSRQPGLQTQRRLQRSVTAHRLIYEAIAAREPTRAHSAMAMHIDEILQSVEDSNRD
jgi:GntR family transcriptional repressor for pyruvate dehydrogenase complex